MTTRLNARFTAREADDPALLFSALFAPVATAAVFAALLFFAPVAHARMWVPDATTGAAATADDAGPPRIVRGEPEYPQSPRAPTPRPPHGGGSHSH